MASSNSQRFNRPRTLILPLLIRPRGLVEIIAVLYGSVNLAWTYFHWGGTERVTLLANLFSFFPSILAVALAWRVAIEKKFSTRLRWAWFILGVSFLMFLIGNAIWAYLEVILGVEPFPSSADIFYLTFYPLALCGSLAMPGTQQNRHKNLALWFDLLSVLTAATMFVGYFIIVPTGALSSGDLLTQVIASAYPIGSLFLTGGMLTILYQRLSSEARPVFLLLLTGMAIFLASDLAFGYGSLVGTYTVGGWTDAGWNIAQLVFVLAALRQLYHEAEVPVKPRSLNLLDRLTRVLPFAAPILSYGLVLYITLTNFSQAAEWLFVAAVLLTLLIIARQIFSPGFSITSVRTRLILSFLLVSILSIGLVSFFTYLTLRSNLESAWQTLLLSTLIVLILTTVAAVFLVQLFVSPISRLTHVAAQIAAGDLSTKARIESRDEIGILAETFNSMLEALARALQELRGSEARFRTLVEQIPAITYIASLDEAATTLYVSPQVEDVLGFTPTEWIADPDLWRKQLHPEDAERVLAEDERSRLSGEPFSAEYRIFARDGRVVWFHDESRWVRDENGQTRFTQGIEFDITERKHTEEEVVKFKLGIESSSEAVFMTNVDGTIRYINPAFEKVYGYTWEEAVGKTPRILKSGLTPLKTYRYFWATLLAKQPIRGEFVNRKKNGQYIYIEGSNTPILDENGNIKGFLAVHRDVTERKQAEEQIRQLLSEVERQKVDLEIRVEQRTEELNTLNERLQGELVERKHLVESLGEAKDMAEAASRAKSEFLSRMSHELRTPMNAILGFAQLLELSRKEPLTSTQKDRVRQIVRGGQHLLDLINEILDISRIEANRLQISPEPVSIQESIKEVLDLTAPLAASRNIQLQTSLEADSNPYVMADRQRLKQILLNLLSNAVKYNYDGGLVMVSCEQARSGAWRISVSDTGSGISAENLGRLFIPFERLVTDQANVEGTGLGLALAKRLVELMDGQIGVESVVGRGSTFWIELPAAKRLLDGLRHSSATGELPVLPDSARTVLYIEDNITNFELIQQVLTDYDQIQLLWATNPEAGLALARKHQPNLILLDLHLGGIDGSEVLKQLKQNDRTLTIPVVMVTADATPGQADRLVALGAHSYLTKPLDVKLFVQLLEELMTEGAEAS